MGGSQSADEAKTPRKIDPEEAFKKIDKDKSGTLSKPEVSEALKELGKSDADIASTINSFGSRKSLKLDEFKALLEGKELPEVAAPAPKSEAQKGKAKSKSEAAAAPKAKTEKAKGKATADAPKAAEKGKADKGESKGKGKGEKGKKGDGKASKESDTTGGKGKGKSFQSLTGPYGSGSGFRLNIKNLPDSVDTSALKEMFTPFGEVSSCEVKKQDNGKSRGFGFIVLPTKEAAEKAILYMNGKEVGGKSLSVVPAERRESAAPEIPPMKGKGKGGKDMQQSQLVAAAMQQQQQQQQQYIQAAYMQQYQQYYYLQQLAYMQQQQQQQQQQSVVSALDPANQIYEGSLKSISAKNGYGFIVCNETFTEFGRDVYVDKEVLPYGAKPMDRMKFTVALNQKNHPRAVACELA